jgi:hypothetical protein
MPKAHYWPVVGTLMADRDGRLLVQRLDLQRNDRRGVWDVLEGKAVVGLLETPKGFTPKVFRRCTLIGVVEDDMDVQSVVRYRMEPCTIVD